MPLKQLRQPFGWRNDYRAATGVNRVGVQIKDGVLASILLCISVRMQTSRWFPPVAARLFEQRVQAMQCGD
jgi:hypothetical protein